MKKNYSWLAPLAWSLPSLLEAMAAHPVAAVALMGYAYLMLRQQP